MSLLDGIKSTTPTTEQKSSSKTGLLGGIQAYKPTTDFVYTPEVQTAVESVVAPAPQTPSETKGVFQKYQDWSSRTGKKLGDIFVGTMVDIGKEELAYRKNTPILEQINEPMKVAGILNRAQQNLAVKALNTEVAQKVSKTIADKTGNLGLKGIARLQSVGEKTYDEAYQAVLKKKDDPTNNQLERILYGGADSVVQSVLIAGLSIAAGTLTKSPKIGTAVSGTLFGAVATDAERQRAGSITPEGVRNIAIDTIGDTIISNWAGALLQSFTTKEATKLLSQQFIKQFTAESSKAFGIEGSTEVLQSIGKYVNQYLSATTPEAKARVQAELINYAKSGAMLDEFLVGGVAGGIIGGGATVAGVASQPSSSLQPKKKEEKKKMLEESGIADAVRQDVETGGTQQAVSDLISETGITEEQAVDIVNTVMEETTQESGILNAEDVASEVEAMANAVQTESRLQAEDSQALADQLEQVQKDLETAIGESKKTLQKELEAIKAELAKRTDEISQKITEAQKPVEKPVKKEKGLPYKAPKFEKKAQVTVTPKGGGESVRVEVIGQREDGIIAKGQEGVPMLYTHERFDVAPVEKTAEEKQIEREVAQVAKESTKATQEPEIQEGYTRYNINVSGIDLYADVDPESYGGTAHIEFKSLNEDEPNPVSDTGYRSQFVQADISGLSKEELLSEIVKLGESLAKEEAKQNKGKKKAPKTQVEKVKEVVDEVKKPKKEAVKKGKKQIDTNEEEEGELILKKEDFPSDLAGGLEKDLTLEPPIFESDKNKWSVAITNTTRLKPAVVNEVIAKLEELTDLKWTVDDISKNVFHAEQAITESPIVAGDDVIFEGEKFFVKFVKEDGALMLEDDRGNFMPVSKKNLDKVSLVEEEAQKETVTIKATDLARSMGITVFEEEPIVTTREEEIAKQREFDKKKSNEVKEEAQNPKFEIGEKVNVAVFGSDSMKKVGMDPSMKGSTVLEMWWNGKENMYRLKPPKGGKTTYNLSESALEKSVEKPEKKAKKVVDKKYIASQRAELQKVYDATGPSDVEGFTKADEELNKMLVEMDLAEAGKQSGYRGPDGENVNTTTQSTFPDYIPSELRSRELFDKITKGINYTKDLQYPSGNQTRQRSLTDWIFKQLDVQLDVDTSAIRNNILQAYEGNVTEGERGGAEISNRSDEGNKGGTGQKEVIKTSTKETNTDFEIVPKQKNKLAQSIMQIAEANNFDLNANIGESLLTIDNPPYMDLSIERQSNKVFISHVGIQNGDLMRDPEIMLEIVDGQMIPRTFTNDYAGVKDSPVKPNEEIVTIWAQNLLDQGFARGKIQGNEQGNDRRPDIRGDNTGRISDTGEVLSGNDSTNNQESHDLGTGELAYRIDELGNGLSGERTDVIVEKIGKKGRQNINEQVKALLESKNYSNNREDYTDDDIALLKLYSGAGGKESAGAEGKGLLSEFYTPNKVVQKTWELALQYAGNVETAFEPSAGTGRYIMLRPEGVAMDGIELDLVSGTVAQIINEDSNIQIGDFQSIFFQKEGWPEYDLVIGNPPYGARGGFIKGKGEEAKIDRWEEYFIKRGLDMTKEGGVVAYVVNSSFLQKGPTFGKTAIGKLGKLEAAYRLPEGTFEDTTIGTDIVIFRKETTNEVLGNTENLSGDRYFKQYPENILGETKTRTNRFGKEETYVTGDLSALDKIKLDETIVPTGKMYVKEDPRPAKLHGVKEAQEKGVSFEGMEGIVGTPALITSYKGLNIKDIFFKENELADSMIINGFTKHEGKTMAVLVPNQEVLGVASSSTDNFDIEAYNKRVITVDAEAIAIAVKNGGKVVSRSVFDKMMKEKKAIADAFLDNVKEITGIKKKRNPNKNVKRNSLTQIYPPLQGKKTGNRIISGTDKQFTKRELEQWKNTANDGSIKGFISEADQQRYNFSAGKYYSDEIYYSGNIVKRLEQLELDKVQMTEAQYEKQKMMLESVRPQRMDIYDITFDPQDRHILNIKVEGKVTILNAFLHYISRNQITLPGGVYETDIARFMNGTNARKGTKELLPKIKDSAKRLFNLYIKEHLREDLQKQIVDNFNDTKNATLNTHYENIPVQIEGMSETFKFGKPLELSPMQKHGVSFLVHKRAGLLAWGVGVGKTLGIATATVANMQAGNCKRPMIAVPKSTIDQTWIDTFRLAFPNIGLVKLGGLTGDEVKVLRAERGEPKDWVKDGEVALITHQGLTRLGYSQQEIEELTNDLQDAVWQEKATKRGEETEIGKIEEIMGAALRFAGNVKISDLGIDHISVDEVHNHRNMFAGARIEKDDEGEKSKKKRFSNVQGGKPSLLGQHLFLTTQYIQKKYGGNVFLASATPFENKATEVYAILSLIARPKLAEMGIYNINDFYAMFANFVPSEEVDQKGEVKTKDVMKSWKNLSTLQNLLREYIDRREDPTLIRPERRVMTPILAMSALQEENNAKIQAMLQGEESPDADQIEADPELEGLVTAKGLRPGAHLVAMNYALANSVSPYFVKEFAPKTFTKEELIENSPKIKYTVELISKLKNKVNTAGYGTFVYFGEHGVNEQQMVKDYMVEHLKFDESEIGIINGLTDIDERERIKLAFNTGEIKVLLGGEPTKEGIDLQNNGYTTINLSLGWNPTQPQQVEGRVWRQGNKLNIAPIIYPLVENSGDVTLYQKYEQKGGRINDLFSWIGQTFDTEEMDPQEKKLSLITDPKVKAHLEIAFDNSRLDNERVGVLSEQRNLEALRDEREREERSIKRLEDILTDKTQYGYEKYAPDWKKELAKSKAKVKRMNESLEKKRIIDLNGEIMKLQTLVSDLEGQIRDLNSTYDERLERFTTERIEEIRNRKTIADHIDDFFTATADLREYTEEELAALKEAKIREVNQSGVGVKFMRKFTRDKLGKFAREQLRNTPLQHKLEPKEIASLTETQRDNYKQHIIPQLNEIPPLQGDEVYVYFSGHTGQVGQYIDLEFEKALDRGIVNTINIIAYPESLLITTGDDAKDANLERKLIEQVSFKRQESLTTKILKQLEGKKTVSKQFIADATKQSDIKGPERELITRMLADEGDTVDVPKFVAKVKTELLPLDFVSSEEGESRYEGIVLPNDLRGAVHNYEERVYNSPIPTSAGKVHFNGEGSENYFAHTRIENMAGNAEGPGEADPSEEGTTRRILELQSDLFQKGRLEKEVNDMWNYAEPDDNGALAALKASAQAKENREKELAPLQPYRNTWQERIIREEVKQAALDGMKKLQFPTGETAMKIEGLGQGSRWVVLDKDGNFDYENTYADFKVGDMAAPLQPDMSGDLAPEGEWIITDILGDGKFKAVPKETMNEWGSIEDLKSEDPTAIETFDISGTVNKSNPIYLFYEKEVAKYIRNRYGAKLVTDAQGVTWFEMDVKPEMAGQVEAFMTLDEVEGWLEKKIAGRLIGREQTLAILQQFKDRLGIDFNVQFFDKILTGEKTPALFSLGGKESDPEAWGVTVSGAMAFTEKTLEVTPAHEVVHFVLNNLDQMPEFGVTKAELNVFADDEAIASGFESYWKTGQTGNFSTKIVAFFKKLATMIREILGIEVTKAQALQKFYYNVMYMRRFGPTVRQRAQNLSPYTYVQNGELTLDFKGFRGLANNKVKEIPEDLMKDAPLQYSRDLIRKDIHLLNGLFSQARDIYLKNPEEFKGADIFQTVGDTRQMKKGVIDRRFAEMLTPYFSLPKDEKIKLNIALSEGDRQIRKWNKAELATFGVTSATAIGTYYKTREAFEYAHDMLLAKMEQNGVKETEIDQFRALRVGYIPHRWAGRYVVKTRVRGEDGKWKTESMQDYRFMRTARNEHARLKETETENLAFDLDTLDSVDVDFFTAQHLAPENIISAINRSKVPEEFRQEVIDGIRNMSKEKGFGRYYIRRTNIKGYETENLDKVFADYFTGLAGYVTKMEAAPMYFKALQTIDPRRQKKFYSWMRDAIAYDMGSTAELNGVKQAAFVWMLANDISYLLVNATQNMIVGVGELSKYMKGAKKIAGAETALLGAMTSYWSGNISEEERKAIEFLLKNGRLGGEMTSELMGFKSNPVYRTISNKFTKALYFSTAFVESKINRVPAFIAARRTLLANGADPATVDRQALKISDDIHYRYGKHNKFAWERGRKGTLFVFMHYTIEFLHQLARDLSKREFMALGKKMFYTTLLGGVTALPFAKLWLNIYREIFGDDDDDVNKELSTWELALKKGIPALIGIDLSGRVSIDILQFETIFRDPTNVVKWFGAAGGLLDRFYRGYGLLKQERYSEAASKLVPDGLGGNFFKAYSGYTYGVRSQAGKLLERSPGVPMKYTPWEATLRGIGVTPTDENLAWERRGKVLDKEAQQSADSSIVRRKIETRILAGDLQGARALEAQAKADDKIGDTSTPVEDYIEKPALMKYAARAHAGESLALMKKSFIAEVYPDEKLSPQKKAAIDKKFDSYAMFGPDNELVTALLGGKTNEVRAKVLLQARQDMGPEAFAVFFGKAKRTKLISDELAKLYRKEQAKTLNQ